MDTPALDAQVDLDGDVVLIGDADAAVAPQPVRHEPANALHVLRRIGRIAGEHVPRDPGRSCHASIVRGSVSDDRSGTGSGT